MQKMQGQTMVELLIAMGVFVVVISSLAFFIFDSYASGRLAQEITIANFLAEEGLEAARSIRDNSWESLSLGSHGLIISGNNWVFQGTQDDINSLIPSGKREIIIEDLNPPDVNRKKVTSQVSWEFTPARSQTISLATYFTNWSKVDPYLKQLRYRWRNDDGGE